MNAARRFLLLLLLAPAIVLESQARPWPTIKDASPLVAFAKEKIQVRERYLTDNRKLDFAFLPEAEWPQEISALKPQGVLIERDCLMIMLVFDLDSFQAIAVVPDTAAFAKDAAEALLVENTSDPRIKRVVTKAK
jgi:hypothetical protein